MKLEDAMLIGFLTSASILVFFLIRSRNRKVAELRWPSEVSYQHMVSLVGKYFRLSGWQIRPFGGALCVFMVSNHGGEFAVRCLPNKFHAVLKDATEVWITDRHAVPLLISADKPSLSQIANAREIGVILIHYIFLKHFVKLNPATRSAALDLVDNIIACRGNMPVGWHPPSAEPTASSEEVLPMTNSQSAKSNDKPVHESLESAVDHAWKAYNGQDWLASFDRWERIRKAWPKYAPPYVHAATSLQKLNRINEAVSLLRLGHEKLPEEPQILTSYVAALMSAKDYSVASDALESAMIRFPRNPELGVDFLRIAIDKEDYHEALRRSAIITKCYPDLMASNDSVRRMIAHAKLCAEISDAERIGERDGGEATVLNSASKVETVRLADIEELMLSFEGLGENCEFGLVQRHFCVEPLGLLRWTATSVENLVKALDAEFLGVGSPEHTRLVEIGDEYMTAVNQYGMGSHTFVKVNKANEHKIFDRVTRRLQFLRRKLVEDLTEGRKTFVYHCESGVSDSQLSELHRATRRYGNNTLLCVQPCDKKNSSGSVRYICDGLMVGYIDRLGPDRRSDGDYWNPSFEVWLTICKVASNLRKENGISVI